MKRTAYAAIGVAIMVSTTAAPTFAQTPSAPKAPSTPGIETMTVPDVGVASADPAEYWTEKRMREAIPADNLVAGAQSGQIFSRQLPGGGGGKPEIGAEAVAPTVTTPLATARSGKAPTTAGKIFFKKDKRDYVCSGSAINNKKKNLVVTAGHCIHGGKGGKFHENIVFAPKYDKRPNKKFGVWVAKDGAVLTEWSLKSNYYYDQGFFTVKPHGKKKLVQVVGGRGALFRESPSQKRATVWGWPAAKPFNGKTAKYCAGKTFRIKKGDRDAIMRCNLTGGASGGPWTKAVKGKGSYIFAVTSRGTVRGPKLIAATPFDKNVQGLYNYMARF